VINAGVEATAYADHLVAIARDLRRRRLWAAAPAIERSSGFERRVQAMLDTRLNRRPVPRAAYVAVAAAMLAITIPIASAQSGFSTLTGSIVDPSAAALPGVTLVLTNPQTEAKWEVRSDGTGRYEFVGIPAGEYLFEARLPGFMSFKGRLALSGQTVQRDLSLEIGSLTESITVASSRANPVMPSTAAPKPALPKRPRPECGAPSAAASAVRVGGNIRAPHKLRDVRPIYPVHLATAGIEGPVVLKARIGADGLIEDVSVVSAAHPELASAAADAVRQWEFDETLLNCKPIPVNMTANVTFVLR
jgi:TonB family protein